MGDEAVKRRPERILLGRIVGVSGLQGWLKVHSDTVPREDIDRYTCWQLGKRNEWNTYQVEKVKRQGKRILGKLAGCDNRESAEALVGLDIAIESGQLEELAKHQYYWVDLQGLQVTNHEGVEFGRIKRVFDTGANDVIVVQGDRERLIPWVIDDVIKAVDLAAGTVTVDWDPEF